MKEIPIYCTLLVSCPLGLAALWIWGPGRPWWRSLPGATQMRWIMYAQLALGAVAITMTVVWWPAAPMAILMFCAARVTGREVRLEVESARLERVLNEMESSGEMAPEVVQSLRRALDTIHRIGT